MFLYSQIRRRPGVNLVESAIVYSLTMLLLLGLLIGGLGVYRYQEVASLSREGARWASVHGSQYATDTGNSAATASDVYSKAISPGVTVMDPANLSYSVTWSPDNSPGSTVNVVVTYKWVPEAYLVGPLNLTSTSSRTMSY